MNTKDFKQSSESAINFLQCVLDKAELNILVESLSEHQFEQLMRDTRSRLNWRAYFPHYLSNHSFHAGFRLIGKQGVVGAFLTVYSSEDKHLHVLLLESLIRNQDAHPLSGRLTTLALIGIIDLLSAIPDSIGVFIVSPHKNLVEYYKEYGFSIVKSEALIMQADIATLQQIQNQIMIRLQS